VGFFFPLFLIATVAVAVPLLLHLFHRHESTRVAFPALRYLLRTEKEHARRIRFRQILLLLTRLAVIVLMVLAGSRLFLRGTGGSHDPTAVVLILDNSMSAGVVVGDERMLDQLKRLALETVQQATPDDQLWVIRAGEPWDVAPPGGPEDAAARILSTELSAASGNLTAALVRARDLLLSSHLRSREIHVLSDLQLSAFSRNGETRPAEDLRVVVYRPSFPPPVNRYLHDVVIGGGLPPVAGQRTELSVTVGSTEPFTGDEVPLRLVIDGRIQAASSALPGRAVILPIGPFPEGLVMGTIETDPDALHADDVRHFVFRVRPPPVVAIVGSTPFFLDQALMVLEEGGRIRRGTAAAADVLFSIGGEGLDAWRNGQTAVILPPSDPALLPALNRRIAQAGLPWRVEPSTSGSGEAEVAENRLSVDLGGVRALGAYALRSEGPAPLDGEVAVRLSSDEPWLVTGASAQGSYLLFGSPLEPESTSLPVSAAMVPFLEWATSLGPAGGTPARRIEAGQPLPVDPEATHVRMPSGTSHPVDGTQAFRETREAGVYVLLRNDVTLESIAVGAPVRESLLGRLDPGDIPEHVGSRARIVADPVDWPSEIFTSGRGWELWKLLLAAALLLMVLENWIAAPGRTGAAPDPRTGKEARRKIGVTVP